MIGKLNLKPIFAFTRLACCNGINLILYALHYFCFIFILHTDWMPCRCPVIVVAKSHRIVRIAQTTFIFNRGVDFATLWTNRRFVWVNTEIIKSRPNQKGVVGPLSASTWYHHTMPEFTSGFSAVWLSRTRYLVNFLSPWFRGISLSNLFNGLPFYDEELCRACFNERMTDQ